jgi:SAM-dependent methyltransferase
MISDNKKFYCSFCEKSFDEFGDFGSPIRKNVLCLSCKSLERHRLLWMFWKDKTNLFSSSRPLKVLHFAPESMFHRYFSQSDKFDYYACDLNAEKFSSWKIGSVIKADITDIPFEDNFFDVIICNHVLEHIPNDHKAMTELYRVMKGDGWGVLQVPIKYSLEKTYEDSSIDTPEGRAAAFGQHDHVRYYGKDYPQKLSNAGFVVDENDYVKTFSEEEITRFGLPSYETLYVCTKS